MEGALRGQRHFAVLFIAVIFAHSETSVVVVATGTEQFIHIYILTIIVVGIVDNWLFWTRFLSARFGLFFAIVVVAIVVYPIVDGLIHPFQILQRGIVEQFLPHLFLKVLCIQLKQLDKLNLLRTQLLKQLLR